MKTLLSTNRLFYRDFPAEVKRTHFLSAHCADFEWVLITHICACWCATPYSQPLNHGSVLADSVHVAETEMHARKTIVCLISPACCQPGNSNHYTCNTSINLTYRNERNQCMQHLDNIALKNSASNYRCELN